MTEEKVGKKLHNPVIITNNGMVNSLRPPYISGIFATFMGYSTFSDANGQIAFPYKAKKTKFNVIVTASIKPVFMRGNTIHNYLVPETKDLVWYTYNLTKGKDSKKYFWQVKEKQDIANKNLPIDSIIILAKPKEIDIKTGLFPVFGRPNVILPEIYAQKNISTTINAVLNF